MSLSRLRQAPWLCIALQVLVLCFALGTLAHAGHTHELGSSSTETHYNCDYCTSFGGLIDAPTVPAVVIHKTTTTTSVVAPNRLVVARLIGLPQARAPPAL
ncbi:MAG: DUF2946 family protein [Steroidobacteraceae bacterium]